jgi:hypothetical protein
MIGELWNVRYVEKMLNWAIMSMIRISGRIGGKENIMNDLTLVLPVAIGGRIWDIDFPEMSALVMGYRIGRMMGEDDADYEESYEDGELYIQYTIGGVESSSPVSSIGESLFLTKDELIQAVSQN